MGLQGIAGMPQRTAKLPKAAITVAAARAGKFSLINNIVNLSIFHLGTR